MTSLLKAKDQALHLYQGMKREKAQFVVNEKDYKDRSNKMGAKLNSRLDFNVKLQEEIRALRVLGEKVNHRAEVEQKKFKAERAW